MGKPFEKFISLAQANWDLQKHKQDTPELDWVVVSQATEKGIRYSAAPRCNDVEFDAPSHSKNMVVSVTARLVSDTPTQVCASINDIVMWFDKQSYGYCHYGEGLVILMGRYAQFSGRSTFPKHILPY